MSHHKDGVTRAFSTGCSGVIMSVDEVMSMESIKSPIVIRGLRNMTLLKPIIESKNIDFYFIDTGYFGNYPKKKFHRVTKNATQQVILNSKRGSERLDLIGDLKVLRWKKKGKKILLCPPSAKSILYYYGERRLRKKYKGSPQLAVKMWTDSTIKKLSKHTSRPIEIREKPRDKVQRYWKDPFRERVLDDIFATVTFNSIVAVESIINGVPAFVCAENAAKPVAKMDLTEIEDPAYFKRKKWLRSLSYCQFTADEMASGLAWSILTNDRSERTIKVTKRKKSMLK